MCKFLKSYKSGQTSLVPSNQIARINIAYEIARVNLFPKRKV